MTLKLITAATEEPVSVIEAQNYLRVEHTEDQVLIASLIAAARGNLDGKDGLLGRALVTQIWDLILDRFPCGEIQIPLRPVQSIAGIFYTENGVESQVSTTDYYADIIDEGRVLPISTYSWPVITGALNSVRVRFTAGYGAALAVPPPIKLAILMVVADLYANREASVEKVLSENEMVCRLLSPYQVPYV